MRSRISNRVFAGINLGMLLALSMALPMFGALPKATEQAELTASDAAANAGFGGAVAIDVDTAVIGAPEIGQTGTPSGKGEVYVFTRSGTAWAQTAKLTAADGQTGDAFGFSVALSNGTVIVGAPRKNGFAGAVYVFTQSGGNWIQQAELGAPGPSAYFGYSVALTGNTLAIGDPNSVDAGVTGAVYVFARSNGVWNQQATLAASDPSAERFGFSVAMSGGTMAVGCPGIGNPNFSPARAYIFTLSSSGWTQTAELSPSGDSSTDLFGSSIAIDSGTVVVGAPNEGGFAGAAYVFALSGTTWTQQTTLTASDGGQDDEFGSSAAIEGNTIVIGAPLNNISKGAGYSFARTGGAWVLQEGLLASDGASYSSFGASAAISNGIVILGAPWKQISESTNAGAAYVFGRANAVLLSNPPGRSFQLSGDSCNTPGQFTTPYTGYLTTCSLEWITPDTATPQTRYTFEDWWDGSTDNPRTFSPDPTQQTVISADFLTEYQLTTQVSPNGSGIVTGAGFYPAGTSATIDAFPQPGLVFTGYTGAASGVATPQSLVVNGPETVTGFFSAIPISGSSAVISAKSGGATERSWTVTITNNGPGNAYDTRLFGVMLTQTFGGACNPIPIRINPLEFPILLGNLPAGGSAQTSLLFDFAGCPANARFSVTIGEMSNGGSSVGLIQLVNQFQ